MEATPTLSGVGKPSEPSCDNARGLTAAEARARLSQLGPNAVREEQPHPLHQFLLRFWAPIPWLLEATIIIQLFLGERVEAGIIAALLALNAVLGFLQEGKAQKALALPRQQLQVEVRVRRDGQWNTINAEELVPDDLIHLRQGTIVPADVRMCDGSLLVDQSALTARAVAEQVGIPPEVCPSADLHGDISGDASQNSVYAGVFPEDKFKLVRAFQRQGAVVGMSGDGVNDAPALRQAEVGVAVANATDVAKAAAAIVLTRPGLAGLVPAIEASRRLFQRVMAYTLNMIARKIELMLLLVVGFLLTGHRPLTPLLMVLQIFLNDFLTMALATDQMSVASRPNQWRTRAVVGASTTLAFCKLLFSLGVFLFAYYLVRLDPARLQTLTFATPIIGLLAVTSGPRHAIGIQSPWW
jgi:magnesium-transporting ATPase (P-type)